jgi:hypothetical protein
MFALIHRRTASTNAANPNADSYPLAVLSRQVLNLLSNPRRPNIMPKYVIEREIPGAGNMKPEELQAASQKSCGVLKNLGPQIQWLHSYVTQDKLYCAYIAPNEKMVREHASQGGFPANKVSEIKTTIDPTTAE